MLWLLASHRSWHGCLRLQSLLDDAVAIRSKVVITCLRSNVAVATAAELHFHSTSRHQATSSAKAGPIELECRY